MKRHLARLTAPLAVVLASALSAEAGSWIFRSSTYSHDPQSGQRVWQYAQHEPAVMRVDPNYLESGYRHNQVNIVGPDGAGDHLHIVQTWGAGEWVRPYGEWEYPFRAGATPYGPWGNPQGPWTMPFDSWVNPYGLNQLPRSPWPYWPYQAPQGYPSMGPQGYSPMGPQTPSPSPVPPGPRP